MGFLFTSESVSEGHPDKVSDQISDAILDEFLRRDSSAKVACETLCTTGLVVVSGEVRSDAYVDIQGTARRVIDRIGYNRSELQFDAKSCGILSAIHEQSSDAPTLLVPVAAPLRLPPETVTEPVAYTP